MLEVSNLLCNIAAFVGLTLIVWSLCQRIPLQAFPGKYAVLPVLGAVLLIAAGPGAWLNAKLFSHCTLVYVGKISYPLYLWHWPLLTFARILGDGELSSRSRNIAILLSVILASATYHLFEKPIRSSGLLQGTKTIILVLVLFMLGTSGYYIYKYEGIEARYALPATPILKNTRPTISRTARLGLLGDSNAAHFSYGLSMLYKDSLVKIFSVGWPYLAGTVYRSDYVPHPKHIGNPKTTEKALVQILSDSAMDVVILSNSYTMYFNSDNLRSYPTSPSGETTAMAYKAGLRRTAMLLTDAGKKVIYVKSIPTYPMIASVAACATNARPLARSRPDACAAPLVTVQEKRRLYEEVVSEALDGLSGVTVFNTLDYLCDQNNCYVEKDGILMYVDQSHLSIAGSQLMGVELAKLIERLRATDSRIAREM